MKTQTILSLVLLSFFFFGSTEKADAQVLKTNLHVTVIDGLGNRVEGANITIYASPEDYKADRNPIVTGLTNKKGKFQFKELESKTYYLDVRKGEMNNDGEGVQTSNPLRKGKITKVNIVIE